MSKSREQLNQFLRKINIEGRTVLDVGVQDKPSSRLASGTPKSYFTMDYDDQWNPDIVGDLNQDFKSWDWGSIIASKPRRYAKNALFDTIFCIEVIEHIWDPVQAVKNMYQLLTPGGELYISTPFINPHHDTHDYLRYTNEWYRDVLPKLGFSNVEIHERVATVGRGLLQSFYKVEGLRVSKIRPEYGQYTYPIGYFVKAVK